MGYAYLCTYCNTRFDIQTGTGKDICYCPICGKNEIIDTNKERYYK